MLSNCLNGRFKDNNSKCQVFILINFHEIWTFTKRLFSFSLGSECILEGLKSFFPHFSAVIYEEVLFSIYIYMESMWIPSYHLWYLVYLWHVPGKYHSIHQSVLKMNLLRVMRIERGNYANFALVSSDLRISWNFWYFILLMLTG